MALRYAGLSLIILLASCSDTSTSQKVTVVATPVDPTTAGTIHVTVRYDGPVPPPKVLDMRSAAQCAAAHSEPVDDQSLVVHDGHLANAVVWIKDGLKGWVFAPPSTPVTLDQKGCIYAPHVAAAMVSQPIEFVNSDPEAHNVHGRPNVASGFNFLMARKGATRTLSFDAPEVAIPIACDIHPWMRAYLAIIDNPYFAVTPSSGAVTLEKVPPGDYVIAVWQEKLGTKDQRITLAPRGAVNVQFVYTPPE